jgi:hypothetical protein
MNTVERAVCMFVHNKMKEFYQITLDMLKANLPFVTDYLISSMVDGGLLNGHYINGKYYYTVPRHLREMLDEDQTF